MNKRFGICQVSILAIVILNIAAISPAASGESCSALHSKYSELNRADGRGSGAPFNRLREALISEINTSGNYNGYVCQFTTSNLDLCQELRRTNINASSPNFYRHLLARAEAYELNGRNFPPQSLWWTEQNMMAACAREWANEIGKSGNTKGRVASNVVGTNSGQATATARETPEATPPINGSRTDSDRARSGDEGAQAQDRQKQLKEAVALAQRNQAKIDKARQGKPKRHVAAMEAHHCLKPLPLTGVTNTCPFAIEYSYCVFHPAKDSWSESFDCEQSKGGSWQIGPGPGNQSILHSAGEVVYWFACKYGPALHQPDGVSPADVHFEPGRGLMGRCAEWGSRRG